MKKSFLLLLAVAVLLVSFTGCGEAPIGPAYTGTPEEIQAWQLNAPSGLEATAGDGYVYLSWDAVANADMYAIFRESANTGTQYLATVNAMDSAVYISRAIEIGVGDMATADGTDATLVGGGCTFLDYVNLNNPMEAGSHKYFVMAIRDLRIDYVMTDVAGDNLIRFCNSELSASKSVNIETVPAKGSFLSVNTASVAYTYLIANDYYNVSWDLDPLAGYYNIYALTQWDTIVIDQMTDETEILNYILTKGVVYDDADPITPAPVNLYKTSVNLNDNDFSVTPTSFAVISFPYDDYFMPYGYATETNRMSTLAIPENVLASTNHEAEIIVSWDVVADADDYEIWRIGMNDTTWTQLTTTTADFIAHESDAGQLYYVDSNVTVGVGAENKYRYKIRSVVGTEVSRYSATAEGSVDFTASNIKTLAKVSDLVATGVGNAAEETAGEGTVNTAEFTDKVELTWSKVDNADQYIIYRSEGDAESYEILAGPSAFTNLETDETKVFYEDRAVTRGVNGVAYLYYYYVIPVCTDYDGAGTPLYGAEGDPNIGFVLPTDTVNTQKTQIAAPTIQIYQPGNDANITVEWMKVEASTTATEINLAATKYEIYASEVMNAAIEESTLVAVVNGNAVGATVSNAETVLGTGSGYYNGTIAPVVAATSSAAGYDLAVTLDPANVFVKGTEYYITVKAVNDAGSETYYSTPAAAATTAYLDGLTVPVFTNYSATPGTGTADISFEIASAVNGADSYTLLIGTDSGNLVSGDASVLFTVVLSAADITEITDGDGVTYTYTAATGAGDFYARLFVEDADTPETSYSAVSAVFTVAGP